MAHDIPHDKEAPPPGAPEWVTAPLLRSTLALWQPYYSEQLTVADALDILLAVSRLTDTIWADSRTID